MNRSFLRFFQCAIVSGFLTYLVEKWISGRLSYYINLRFLPLTLLGIFILAVMSFLGLRQLLKNVNPHPSEEKTDQKEGLFLLILFLLPVAAALLNLPGVAIIGIFVAACGIGLWRLVKFPSFALQETNNLPNNISTGTLLIVALPLLLGALVPARPLSTASLNNRGMSLSAPASLGEQKTRTLDVAPDDRTVLDWIKLFNYETDLSPFIGQEANVIGFVYHDPRLSSKQFMVGRFSVTCCVADAFAIGMAVDWPESANLQDNTWVNVKGTVDMITIDDQKVPLIHAKTITPVKAPEQPYLYP